MASYACQQGVNMPARSTCALLSFGGSSGGGRRAGDAQQQGPVKGALHGAADGKPAAGEPKRVATDSNLKNRALRFMRTDPCTTR